MEGQQQERELDKLRKTIEEFRIKAEKSGNTGNIIDVRSASLQSDGSLHSADLNWGTPNSTYHPPLVSSPKLHRGKLYI